MKKSADEPSFNGKWNVGKDFIRPARKWGPQCVAVTERQVSIVPKVSFEKVIKPSVKLDDNDPTANNEELSGNNPLPGTNFENKIVWTNGRSPDELTNEYPVSEKIL